jgi:hypothetical protein
VQSLRLQQRLLLLLLLLPAHLLKAPQPIAAVCLQMDGVWAAVNAWSSRE